MQTVLTSAFYYSCFLFLLHSFPCKILTKNTEQLSFPKPVLFVPIISLLLMRYIRSQFLFYVLIRCSTTAFRFFDSIVFPILLLKFKSIKLNLPILFSFHLFFLWSEFDKIYIETATRFVVSNFFEKKRKNKKNGFGSMHFC